MNSDYIECFRKAAAVLLIVATVAAVLCLTGCKSVKPIAQQRDSVRVEYRHDSVYIYQHDSVFRDRWRSGDTVYVTVEKWQVKWKDRLLEIHDTIRTTQTDTVEVPYVPAYYKRVSTGFWILLALILIRLAWWAGKMYINAQGGGLFLPKS